MPDAISNTSPLLYLYRIEALMWLDALFGEVWMPTAVALELAEGQRLGYDVPNPDTYHWLRPMEPQSLPSEWLLLDLGPGELATMALVLENPTHVVLLDDTLARRVAKTAGLTVWGILKVLPEAKGQGLTTRITRCVDRLADYGMWPSQEIRYCILTLAEKYP
jgi:predicted nucleic acid-binding protein